MMWNYLGCTPLSVCTLQYPYLAHSLRDGPVHARRRHSDTHLILFILFIPHVTNNVLGMSMYSLFAMYDMCVCVCVCVCMCVTETRHLFPNGAAP